VEKKIANRMSEHVRGGVERNGETQILTADDAVSRSEIPGMSQYAADVASGEGRYAARELDDNLRVAIERLPPKARQAITLRWQWQFKNAEIAEIMGVSVKMVEFSIARALNQLRRTLDPP
jgi:RNA polymerase sigma factor (sigma-70 family)